MSLTCCQSCSLNQSAFVVLAAWCQNLEQAGCALVGRVKLGALGACFTCLTARIVQNGRLLWNGRSSSPWPGYEEMQLRTQAWPGDQGFAVLTDRRPAFIHSIPETRDRREMERAVETRGRPTNKKVDVD